MKANKLFLLAMGLVAVGCNDNQLEESPVVPQGEPVNVVINATVATPASRAATSLEDLTNEATGQKATQVITNFEAGDEIGVYFNWATDGGEFGFTQENVLYTAGTPTETGVPYTTSEKVFLLADGNHAYAYYPYAQTGTDFEGSVSRSANLGNWDGYHYFNVPAKQEQNAVVEDAKENNNAGLYIDGFSKYVRLITKECTMVKTGNDVKVDLVFHHAFSYATLVIENTYDQDLTIEEAEATFYDAAGNAFQIVGNYGVKLDKPATADAATKHVDGEALKALEGSTGTTVTLVPAKVSEDGEDTLDLTLAAGETTKLVATVAPMKDIASYKIVVRTKEDYVFEHTFEYDAPKQLAQGYSRRFAVSLDPTTLSTEVTSSDIAKFMLQQTKEEIVLDLAADITLPVYSQITKDAFLWGGTTTQVIKINGNGHTLTFDLQDAMVWNAVTIPHDGVKVIIEDAIICSDNPQGSGDWDTQLVHFHCDVELKDVTTYAGLVLHQDAVLNNVTFNGVYYNAPTITKDEETEEVAVSGDVMDTYSLFLMPLKSIVTTTKQVVKIDNCTFNGVDGMCRAIKIDGGNLLDRIGWHSESIVPVELTVSNTMFNTPKKAAIMVNTAKGAAITIGEGVVLNEEVAAEHVWIDLRIVNPAAEDDNAEYELGDKGLYFVAADGISVTGGDWKFEGAAWSVLVDGTAEATSGAGLRQAIKYGMDNIKLVYGGGGPRSFDLGKELAKGESREIKITADVEDGLTVKAYSGQATNMDGNDLTLENVTLLGGADNAAGLIAKSLTCTNVLIDYPVGLELNTASANFDGCTFAIETAGAYVNTNAAEEVSFNNCIFNTQGSAILVKNPENAAEVNVTNSFFNAADSYLPSVAETEIDGMKAAAIEIDNAAGEAGAAHVVTTDGNSLGTKGNFSGEWRIRNYVEVDGGVTVNGEAYTDLHLDGKLIYKPTGSDEWHVAR